MKVKLVIIIFFTHLFFGGQAQVAPSPDAMGAINLTHAEDLYRGYVSEVVPIYEIEAENGFKVPIQLVYQTRGIKVNDVASSVGLGWNLAAGGAITRVMKDEPDDQSKFVDNVFLVNEFKESQIDHKKGNDYEKDVFYINFPGGSGSFISVPLRMGNDQTLFYGLPYNDLEITFYKTDNLDSYWVVTDTQGIRYEFGTSREGRETTHSRTFESGQQPKPNEDFTYVSTWYLEEISFPNLPGTSDINFTYEKASSLPMVVDEVSYTIDYNLILDKTYYYYERVDKDTKPTLPEPLQYFTINEQSSNGYCCLEKDILMTGNVLDYSTIPLIRQVFGLYDYRKYTEPCGILDDEYTDCDKAPYYYFAENLDNPDFYNESQILIYKLPTTGTNEKEMHHESSIDLSFLTRITSKKSTVEFSVSSRQDIDDIKKVDKIKVLSKPEDVMVWEYDLEYDYFNAADYHTCSGDQCKRLKLSAVSQNGAAYRSFDYINELNPSLELPERGSMKKDKFGYFKNSVNSHYEPYNFKVQITDPVEYSYWLYTNGNAINRTPNGNARANMLWKVNYPAGGYKEFSYFVREGGGVGIESVKLKQGNEIVSGKTYEFRMPQVRNTQAALHTINETNVTLFSSSPYLTFDHLNSAGYLQATVTDEQTGFKTHYEYWPGSVVDYNKKYKWTFSSSGNNVELLDQGSAPLMSPTFSPYTGLLKYVTVMDADEKEISRSEMYYNYGDIWTTIEDNSFVRSGTSKVFFRGVSRINLRPFYLDYSISSTFENGEEVTTKTTMGYDYDGTYKTLLKTSTTVPIVGGEDIETRKAIYYPFDDPLPANELISSSVMSDMVNKHMIGVPVVTIDQIKLPEYDVLKTSGVALTNFQKANGKIHPYQTYSLANDKPGGWDHTYLELINTQSFNSDGLLSSMVGVDGITTTYNYDDQGYLINQTVSPGDATLNRTTSYTYKPLVGVKTITDPNNRTTTYEYDSRNRLRLIRDQDNNIVKRYRYHLGSEDGDGMNATINWEKVERRTFPPRPSTPVKQGDIVHISADIKSPGYPESETQYYWNIDGTNYEGITNIQLAFDYAGFRDVSFFMINPEYDEPFEASLQIPVLELPFSADISISESCRFEGRTVTFTASNVKGYKSHLTTYEWNLNGVIKSGKTVTHAFPENGTKNITLTLRNPNYSQNYTTSSSLEIYASSDRRVVLSSSPDHRTIYVPPLGFTVDRPQATWYYVENVQANSFDVHATYNNTGEVREGSSFSMRLNNCVTEHITVKQYANSGGGGDDPKCDACSARPGCYCKNGSCICR